MSGYLEAMRLYATFEGRTAHTAFLRAQWVFLPLVALAFGVIGFPELGDGTVEGSRSVWPMLAFFLIVGPHALPWAALMVRRLHDMDQPGTWALAALLPYGFILPFPLAGLVIWGSQPGTPGPNSFGPDPLGREPRPASPPTEAATTGASPSFSPHTPPQDVIADLERLAQLRASGALSEAEFEVMKANTLSGRSRA